VAFCRPFVTGICPCPPQAAAQNHRIPAVCDLELISATPAIFTQEFLDLAPERLKPKISLHAAVMNGEETAG
jgi:hypothetical protein